MHVIFLLLGVLALIGGMVCSIIILIDAFQDEIWKGVVCLLCGLYFLYYAFFEFDHENKWLLIVGSLGASAVATAMFSLAMGMPP